MFFRGLLKCLFSLSVILGPALFVCTDSFAQQGTFDRTFQFNSSFNLATPPLSGPSGFNYGFTELLQDSSITATDVTITKISVSASGVNLTDFGGFDFEVFIGPGTFGFNPGQVAGGSNPFLISSSAPTQFRFAVAINEAVTPGSGFDASGSYDSATNTFNASPPGVNLKAISLPAMTLSSGLFVQVLVWTGDSRVDINIGNIIVKVEGVASGCHNVTLSVGAGGPLTFDGGTSMNATFTPGSGLSIDEAAAACGFTGFNWQQTVNVWPAPANPSVCNFGSTPPFNCLIANFNHTVVLSTPPAFPDPVSGGYTYQLSREGSYPFYYSQAELDFGSAGGCGGTALIETTNALNFHDCPADPLLADGQNMEFTTNLVGVLEGNVPGPVLSSWTWASDFDGTSLGSVAANNPPPVDPGSGTGGVVITSVNGVPQTPPKVSCAAAPNTLWPPNGKSVSVTVSGSITAGTSALTATTYAVLDEYGQDQPIGSITLGAGGGYSFAVPLIAARNGDDKDGRTYTMSVRARDSVGNISSCSAIATVPHDQGQ